MNRLTAISTTVFASALLWALPARAEGAKLTLTVTDIANHKGNLMIAVHDEAGYDGQPVTATMKPVSGDTASATFEDLAPGQYAIKLFHDVDGDGEMDTNPFGLPTEPYGFSNNAKGQFGPAKWADAKFEVGAGGAEQTISLK